MVSGVRDGHGNRKSQKSLRFRCAKAQSIFMFYWGEEIPINKEHIRELGGRYALVASRGRFGGESWNTRTSRPDLCAIPHTLDTMSAGQTGHSHGMVAIQMWGVPRDGCDPDVGCPTEFFMFIGFSLPNICNKEINSPRIILRNWRLQRPQTLPC